VSPDLLLAKKSQRDLISVLLFCLTELKEPQSVILLAGVNLYSPQFTCNWSLW
jgi:hypothetical protein